jgi:nicotinate-nucleotide--dimethylbenzimidazole phosphoribosyltransferase
MGHRHAREECDRSAKIIKPIFHGIIVSESSLRSHTHNKDRCMRFRSLDEIRAACRDLSSGHPSAAAAAEARQATLTKPPGSLGRLEELVTWLARWQGRAVPTLARAVTIVFAGNHGVAARGVSAFPSAVTKQMVANFRAGGAAINQLAQLAGTELKVVPLELDRPTADFTTAPAMETAEFLAAFDAGYEAVPFDADLLALGEMGIGNTTAASALCAALLEGGAARWVGRGTGIDDTGLKRKRAVVSTAIEHHRAILADPLAVAAALGGRELAAIAGAVLAARRHGIPTLLDGFVATAAIVPLACLDRAVLDHCCAAHVSAEAGHRLLLHELGLRPLLDFDMRLGEASGAAIAILMIRAAVVCHTAMATFSEAGVSGTDN